MLADGFWLLIIAQCLLAAHVAFKSGTDSSLLYESLAESGRESEIGNELARAQRFGLTAMAIAALTGGLAGGFNLAIPYAMSAIGAVAAIILSIKLIEPLRDNKPRANPISIQAEKIILQLSHPRLRWIFIFSIIIFVLVHVPYEYFQPYIKLLFPQQSDFDNSPLVAGILMTFTMLLGSVASVYSIPLQNRFGTATALVLIMLLAILIILLMSSFLHLLVLMPIMLRNVPMVLSEPIVNSVLHQHTSNDIRASFLSTLSLFSRLMFSMTLLVTAVLIDVADQLDYSQLRSILAGYVIVAVIFLPLLLWGKRNI